MTHRPPAAARRARFAPGGMLLSLALLAWPNVPVRSAAPGHDVRVTDMRVTDAWIRWLPANLPGAGYMTLTNTGPAVRVLTGGVSPGYARVEIHHTHSSNGMTEMSPVDAVELPAHASVRFAEGGYHLMLMQPMRPLHPGDRVTIVLQFAGGASLPVTFAVRGADAGSQ